LLAKGDTLQARFRSRRTEAPPAIAIDAASQGRRAQTYGSTSSTGRRSCVIASPTVAIRKVMRRQPVRLRVSLYPGSRYQSDVA